MYNERRQKLKSIFEDTVRTIRSDGPLSRRTEESVVENVSLIDRGYAKLEDTLSGLGAKIERIP